jgi:SpoIID/LytB domain protein
LLFDVCADDHCQRYQGITRIANPQVAEAIRQTRGEVLTYDNEICDARFSKCCGGWMEVFSSCWDDSDRPYLQSKPDRISTNERLPIPDLRNESEAQRWILSRPEAFCNTEDADILSQVLNNYDQETTDFYRWHQFYTTEQLSILFAKRSGVDVGSIHELIPLERGTSGRIKRLRVVGSKRTFTLGKELEIRKALSESHLYSSAFIVEKTAEGFHLRGAGWGHGVGLCQIGAAVMSVNGHSYQEILNHYYPNTQLKKIYP